MQIIRSACSAARWGKHARKGVSVLHCEIRLQRASDGVSQGQGASVVARSGTRMLQSTGHTMQNGPVEGLSVRMESIGRRLVLGNVNGMRFRACHRDRYQALEATFVCPHLGIRWNFDVPFIFVGNLRHWHNKRPSTVASPLLGGGLGRRHGRWIR